MTPTRRAVLSAVGVASLAGCSSVLGDEQETELVAEIEENDYIKDAEAEFTGGTTGLIDGDSELSLEFYRSPPESPEGYILMRDGEQEKSVRPGTGVTSTTIDMWSSAIKGVGEIVVYKGGEYSRREIRGADILARIEIEVREVTAESNQSGGDR